MDPQWDDSLPIYRQLRDRVVAMILEGALKDGDPRLTAFAANSG
jgi:GntR family transcriptional regulator